MEKVFEKVKNSPLFKDIGKSDFSAMFSCIHGQVQTYTKNEPILLAGNPVKSLGLIVSGSVQILRSDLEGKESLVAKLSNPELFGEAFACAGLSHSPVTVLAAEKSEIFHMNYRKVISTCSSACTFHTKLIENMLALMAQKNLWLNEKMEILSKRTIRERIRTYFDFHHKNADKFTLALNREEWAAYLCVDRSALSAELSKMQKKGLLKYQGKSFELFHF